MKKAPEKQGIILNYEIFLNPFTHFPLSSFSPNGNHFVLSHDQQEHYFTWKESWNPRIAPSALPPHTLPGEPAKPGKALLADWPKV